MGSKPTKPRYPIMITRISSLLGIVLVAVLAVGCTESAAVGPFDSDEIAAKRATAAGQQDGTILDLVLELSGKEEGADFTVLRDIVVGITQNTDIDLIAALSNEDEQYTVFAPNDAAFVALLADLEVGSLEAAVEALGWDGLASVVLYHVTPGRRFAKTVMMQKQLPTLNGASISKAKGGIVLNGNVNIVGPDAGVTSNGVVHVIDAVLLPPTE